MKKTFAGILVLSAGIGLADAATAAGGPVDWPQFRGPPQRPR